MSSHAKNSLFNAVKADLRGFYLQTIWKPRQRTCKKNNPGEAAGKPHHKDPEGKE